MIPDGASVEGRAAITALASQVMKMKVKRVAKTIDVWGNGDLLAEEGTASLYDQKGTELDHAKYLVVWKKEDGQWKLFRDMWNSDRAPAK
jgi:ketosteroid isomerase-like protein